MENNRKENDKTITPIEAVDVESVSRNDNKVTLAIVAVAVILLISLIGFTIWRVYTNSDVKSAKSGGLTLENVSPEIKEQLTGQIIYSKTAGQGAAKYYSPSLDAVLTIDDDTESVSESTDSLNLYIKSAGYATPFYITIQKTELSLVEFVESKCVFTEECNKGETIEEDSTVGMRFNFLRKAFFTEEDKTEKVFAAAYKLIGVEGYVMYIYVVAEDDSKINENVEAALKVFKTLDTNVEGVDNELMVSLEDGIITLPLNRKDWTVDVSPAGSYFSAHHRKESTATTDESYLASGYVSASVESLYGRTLQDIHSNSSKIAEYEKEYGAKFTIENQKIIIGGVEFLHSVYEMSQYETQPEIITYKAFYTGLLDKSQKVVSIHYSLYSDKDKSTVSAKAILDVITKFQFADREVAQAFPGEYGDVLGANTMTIDKVAFLAQPSVAQIFNKTCVNVVANKAYTSSMYVGKTYEVCGAGTGTGFYINGDGYMVTNAHVAAPNPTDVLVGAAYGRSYDPNGFAKDFYYIALDIIDAEYGVSNFTQQQLLDLVMTYAPKLVVIAENDTGISIDSTKYTNYVQADEAFNVNGAVLDLYNTEAHYSSEVVDYNKIESMAQMELDYFKDGTIPSIAVADLALLKVDTKGNSVSSLPLSSASSVLVGSGIRVIGYPGAADNSMLFSSESSRIPTLTTGTISAIKPNATNAFNLIQFDASISGGNSGGPILNENGSVVAVATYGIAPNQAAADYNAGVSVSEVAELLSRNNIEGGSSELSELLEKTVFYLDSHYYKWAVESLDEVITLNSDLESTLAPLRAYAVSQIEDGQDRSPLFAIGDLYIGILEIALMVVSIIVIIIVLVVVMNMKRKSGGGKITTSEPVLMQTSTVSEPVVVQSPTVSEPVQTTVQNHAVIPDTTITPPIQTPQVVTPPTTLVQITPQQAMPQVPTHSQPQPLQQQPSTVTQPAMQQPAPNPMYGLNQPIPPVSPPGMFQNPQTGTMAPSGPPATVAPPSLNPLQGQSAPQAPVSLQGQPVLQASDPAQPQTPLN